MDIIPLSAFKTSRHHHSHYLKSFHFLDGHPMPADGTGARADSRFVERGKRYTDEEEKELHRIQNAVDKSEDIS